ncbi:MAG: MerR family transcriptional regulator [Oscillospiraceae bacterium]|nr:MerR family transcriptional regulator [Oscillospiraceae bacterium]
MMTVHEVSRLTGVSVRTLQYYDQIGLLHPSEYTEAGYRLYNEKSLEKLQQILLFRELQFPLKDIAKIVNREDFDRRKALDQQIRLLTLKKDHLDGLISLAKKIQSKEDVMSFKEFDTSKIDKYAAQAKLEWGNTETYKEFEKKDEGRTSEDHKLLGQQMMAIFAGFGALKECDPSDEAVQNKVKELQSYITSSFYNCTNEILAGLGKMYTADNKFTENIDQAGGTGTAEFVSKAIEIYCQ